jgi:subtilisin family serine protease
MKIVLCPNCRAVTPDWRYCANCNASLGDSKAERCSFTPSPGCNLDPQLIKLRDQVGNRRITKLATASTDENWVAVIAKVSDLPAFKAIDDVKVYAEIAPSKLQAPPDTGETWIVTARMPLDIVEEVRRKDFVISLKAGVRIRPTLENTRKASEAIDPPTDPAIFPPLDQNPPVKRAIVGIVDTGLDFMHRNFRYENGNTRILAIWDQSSPSDPAYRQPTEYGFPYGRFHTKGDINNAIRAAKEVKGCDPELISRAAYASLGYEPPADDLFMIGAHATYVTDIAAGNGAGSGVPGLAPTAEIVFVEFSTHPGPILNNSFGDSAQLLEAVKFIFDFAKKQGAACVINLSLGTNGGPHEGSTLVEQALDRLVTEEDDRAIVIAAGNSYDQRIHVIGEALEGDPLDLKWRIAKNDATPNEIEIWYPREDRITVEIFDPFDISCGKSAPGWRLDLEENRRGVLSVINRLNEPNSEKNMINILFEQELHPGDWTLRLNCTERVSTDRRQFDAWIERDELGPSLFTGGIEGDPPLDRSYYRIDDDCTLNSIACGRWPIVVSSYDATPESVCDEEYKSKMEIGETSSSGPSRNNYAKNKPDLSAPGEHVLAARSRTLALRNRASGTSLAAPVVTGVIATMFQIAPRKLSISEIRDILIETAQHNPPPTGAWDKRYGYGRVSQKAALERVTEL